MITAAIAQARSTAGPAIVTAAKAPKSHPEPRSVPVEIHRSPKKPTSRRRSSAFAIAITSIRPVADAVRLSVGEAMGRGGSGLVASVGG